MNSEIVGIISLLVALITSCIAISQNIKSQKFQNKLAEAQKVFAKSEIKFEFFQTFFKNIIFVGNFPINSIVSIPLEYCYANTGDKKIINAELYVTYPDAVHEWDTTNIKSDVKGSLKDIKYKLVDKSHFKHMLGFEHGDIPPRAVVQHDDFFIISGYRKTDSSILHGETVAESKDKVKLNIRYHVALEWVINFFLRHDEGSCSENCYIQIWNTTDKPLMEYIEQWKPKSKDNTFENYFKDNSLFKRIFLKRQLRNKWNRTVLNNYLIIELDLQRNNNKCPLPQNAPKDAKDISIYEAIVKNQKVLLVLNKGNIVLANREDFEKGNRISHFDIAKRPL